MHSRFNLDLLYSSFLKVSKLLNTCFMEYLSSEFLLTNPRYTECSNKVFPVRKRPLRGHAMLYLHLFKRVSSNFVRTFRTLESLLNLGGCSETIGSIVLVCWQRAINERFIWCSGSSLDTWRERHYTERS